MAAQEILDFLRENEVNNFKLGATIFEEMVKGYEGGFYPSPKMARLYADLRGDILNPKSKVYCESHRTHNIRECLEFPDGWYAVRVKINFGI